MRPGIELDSLIASKVMGWTPGIQASLWSAPDGSRVNMPFHPSIMIGDAWQVVVKLKLAVLPLETGHWWAGEFLPNTPQGDVFEKRIDEIRGVSAPHAICLAALKAVGVDV